MTRFIIATIAALAMGGASAPPAMAQYEDQSVQSFIAADQDGDERLNLSEFRTFIRAMADAGAQLSARIETFGIYSIAFRRVDANNDGFASPEELRAAERRN